MKMLEVIKTETYASLTYEEKLYKSVAGISSHDHLFISESL